MLRTINCACREARVFGKTELAAECTPCARVRRQSREYGLVATISHIGSGTGSGHYTASVLTPDGSWVRKRPALPALVPPLCPPDTASTILAQSTCACRGDLSSRSQVVCDDNHIRPKRAAEVFSDPDAYLLIFERKERAAAG